MQFQGNIPKVEEYLRNADALAPNLPDYQWPIANFYLPQGNTDEAFRHFRAVLAGTSAYDQIVFRTAWRANDDGHKILDQLIPQKVSTEFSYLYYLLSQQLFTEALPVWKRILTGAESFTPEQAAGYIDVLIQAGRPDEAYAVWTDLQRRGLVWHAETGGSGNLLNNGDFEDELLNMGFGWRIATVEGVYAGLDQMTYHSPGHSLLVQFSGKQNLEYRNVYQYVKVEPNRAYRLETFMKTEGITTDSGPRLEVRDAYDRAALEKSTGDLTDTSHGWTDLTFDFTTGPKTSLLVVALERIPSQKLDNLIAGKVWIDDVRLTPVQNERQSSRGRTTP
jgi:pentatricopeptide repeat protein